MKKSVAAVLALVLVFAFSGLVLAQGMEIKLDGMYFLGGTNAELGIGGPEEGHAVFETKDHTYMVSGEVEVYPNVVAFGRYLLSDTKEFKLDEGEFLSEGFTFDQSLVLGGAKYRVLAESDLNVYAGAGYNRYSFGVKEGEAGTLDFDGQGIYGQVAMDLALGNQLGVSADLAYAPKNLFDATITGEGEAVDEDVPGTLTTARGAVTYNINEALGVQLGAAYNSVSIEEVQWAEDAVFGKNTMSNTFYGAGLVARF